MKVECHLKQFWKSDVTKIRSWRSFIWRIISNNSLFVAVFEITSECKIKNIIFHWSSFYGCNHCFCCDRQTISHVIEVDFVEGFVKTLLIKWEASSLFLCVLRARGSNFSHSLIIWRAPCVSCENTTTTVYRQPSCLTQHIYYIVYLFYCG